MKYATTRLSAISITGCKVDDQSSLARKGRAALADVGNGERRSRRDGKCAPPAGPQPPVSSRLRSLTCGSNRKIGTARCHPAFRIRPPFDLIRGPVPAAPMLTVALGQTSVSALGLPPNLGKLARRMELSSVVPRPAQAICPARRVSEGARFADGRKDRRFPGSDFGLHQAQPKSIGSDSATRRPYQQAAATGLLQATSINMY